jgi:2-polyprenyl-3-methyl-5-hydroxy-6-metoxy-1,4-benzoquinol methylase
MSDTGIPDEVVAHYERETDEDLRLRQGMGELELLRTQEIIRRHLTDPPQRILDVGGGSGIHAEWLLTDGHQVHLIDPMPSHVEQALESLGDREGFSAEVGDAWRIDAPSHSYDAVLLLGPLYHLTESSDRVAAWSEARRLVTHHGHVFAAAITRYASLFDGLSRGWLFDQRFRAIAEQDLADGQHRNPTSEPGLFTTAYFHHPDELAEEAAGAGLRLIELVGVEGLASWIPELATRWENPDDRETILFSARAIESEPSLRGLSAHLLAVATHGHGHRVT